MNAVESFLTVRPIRNNSPNAPNVRRVQDYHMEDSQPFTIQENKQFQMFVLIIFVVDLLPPPSPSSYQRLS